MPLSGNRLAEMKKAETVCVLAPSPPLARHVLDHARPTRFFLLVVLRHGASNWMRCSVSKLVRIERPTWATARSMPAFISARPPWYWRSKISSIMVLILSSSCRSKGDRKSVLVVGWAERGLDQSEAIVGVECAPG